MFNALVVLGSGLVACGARADEEERQRKQAGPTDAPGNDRNPSLVDAGEMTSTELGVNSATTETSATPPNATAPDTDVPELIEPQRPLQMLPEDCPPEQWLCEESHCASVTDPGGVRPLNVVSSCVCDKTAATNGEECEEGQTFTCLLGIFESLEPDSTVRFNCRCIDSADQNCSTVCAMHPGLDPFGRQQLCDNTSVGVACGCVIAGIGAR